MNHETQQRFGRIGIWSSALSKDDAAVSGENRDAAAELEELGYGTIWLGGSPLVDRAAPILEATRRITVATGITSIWQQSAAEAAAGIAALDERLRDRFVLGVGASHESLSPGYARPYSAMVSYLDELDRAPVPVPAGQRVLAALGPRMLELAARRAIGAHPYLVTVEHVAQARQELGPDAFLAPELGVVLDPDPARGRQVARQAIAYYLPLPNYTENWLRRGFVEADLADGGSDHLLDELYAVGDEDAIRARVEDFFAAGADHVALQVLTADDGLPHAEWRKLASALQLT
ncbi:LLM class F420-dependent oxidoreductase [Actinacidiphila sp. ITFR-21]|uniref:LLM class F420-dependent oxidoreductase n=1 Tax=Actinacidiphila sp. ITFR-21 TaxID=3075199 RepID=UPI00288C4469|nr:LLM class F420-dependent oxidoreductase [Streptomyces sp. ITFR-21]WNI14363.1 LLM class F420-dependent oxidoreductase [Streptomyces sp. ITFR-21]